MEPTADIRYVRTSDGVAIAYEARGVGPPLLYCRGWISHLELQRRTPSIERFFAPIRQHRTVVKYDSRGNGLSDWDPPQPITKDSLLDDLEAVAATIEPPFEMWATTYGGPLAIEYTARHPDRVSRLLLDGTFARGRHFMDEERAQPFFEMLAMARHNPDVVFSSLSFMTDPSPEMTHEVRVERLRQSISPGVIEELYRIAHEFDVRDLISEIDQPVLVMHREDSRAVPVRAAQRLAGLFPDATLRVLPGRAHNPYEGDWRAALAVVAGFLGFPLDPATPDATVAPAELRVLMFTDMVGSTAFNSEHGDHVAQAVRRTHDDIVRSSLRAHSGSEIKHTGDGIFASFRSVGQAARAAFDIHSGVASRLADVPGLAVRIGLNAGEPHAEQDDLYGGSVQVAARVCDRAAAGEIVITDVVRELLRGKPIGFEDHGVHELKGIPSPMQLWRLVDPGASP